MFDSGIVVTGRAGTPTMNAAMLLQKVGRYGAVGLVAAAVHAGLLLLLSQWISLSLANPNMLRCIR